MILRELINIIESVAPLSYQESWDNSGLQVGDPGMDVQAVLLTTDVTESVVAEAVSTGCQLIVSHHPLLFHGLRSVVGATPQERCVIEAIRHGIAIYSAHTSMDSYLHGVSGRMLRVLGISDYQILVPAANSPSTQTTGPAQTATDLATGLAHTATTQTATTAAPTSAANPSASNTSSAATPFGLGAIGSFPEPMPYQSFLCLVRDRFSASYVRYTACPRATVQRIAVCGGAGAEFWPQALAAGADAYLTADCKYHEMQAASGQIGLVDIDHWTSEHFTRDIFRELLSPYVATRIAESDWSPVMCL